MSKATKTGLIIATILVVAGAIIFIGVMTVFKFDFLKLDTNKYITNTYDITESFENISIDTSIAKIQLLPSEDNQCKVVCYEPEKVNHVTTVKNSTLTIKETDNRKWYEHFQIGFSLDSPKLTVYLPEEKYSSLVINTATGDIAIPENFTFDSIKVDGSTATVNCLASASKLLYVNLSTGKINLDSLTAGEISLSASTGAIILNSVNSDGNVNITATTGAIKAANLNCGTLKAETTTGSIALSNTIATNNFVIDTTTGSVKFDRCDAEKLNVTSTTGSVSGTLLSDKIFVTSSSTGRVNVPGTTTGGVCNISTTTGSIKIDIQA